jgi:hypothetical protein
MLVLSCDNSACASVCVHVTPLLPAAGAWAVPSGGVGIVVPVCPDLCHVQYGYLPNCIQGLQLVPGLLPMTCRNPTACLSSVAPLACCCCFVSVRLAPWYISW